MIFSFIIIIINIYAYGDEFQNGIRNLTRTHRVIRRQHCHTIITNKIKSIQVFGINLERNCTVFSLSWFYLIERI